MMNINFFMQSVPTKECFKKNLLMTLNVLQKKILLIAGIVFAFMGIYYTITVAWNERKIIQKLPRSPSKIGTVFTQHIPKDEKAKLHRQEDKDPLDSQESLSNLNSSNHPFLFLTDEIKINIFSYLSDEELGFTIPSVCKEFARIAEDEMSWKKRTLMKLGPKKATQFFDTFKSWKAANMNYIKMSKVGKVISSSAIFSTKERRIGELVNGKLNGKGKKILFESRRKIEEEGEFNNNELHGQGKKTLPNGIVVEGEFSHGKLTGKGKIIHPDGKVYKGEFEKDSSKELGITIFPDGKVVHGEFENQELHGFGMVILPNNTVYQGEFDKGFLQGSGEITWPDATIFEGLFINGKLNGQGKKIHANGIIYEEGEFKENNLHGKGYKIYSNRAKAEGEFFAGKLNGWGKVSWPDGTLFEGQFINNMLNGQGKRILSSKIYEGEFIDNMLNGHGKIIHPDPDNRIEEGEFKEDQLIEGIIQYPSGKIDHVENGVIILAKSHLKC